MKKTIATTLFIVISNLLFATAQDPDIIYYKGKKYSLFSNPLEQYFKSINNRPKLFLESNCGNTACWRGYIATWEISDKKLFLTEIGTCCWEAYYKINEFTLNKLSGKIPEKFYPALDSIADKYFDEFDELTTELSKYLSYTEIVEYADILKQASVKGLEKADLNSLFGSEYKNGKVEASWFTGTLRIPDGERISYVHMGYGSKYEREIMIKVENGKVTAQFVVDNTEKKEGIRINSIMYEIVLPEGFIEGYRKSYTHMKDTLGVLSADSAKTLFLVASFNKKRIAESNRREYLSQLFDSLKQTLSKDFKFSKPKFLNLTSSTVIYTDTKIGKSQYRRYFICANINSKIIGFYDEKNKKDKFRTNAEAILESIIMRELGY